MAQVNMDAQASGGRSGIGRLAAVRPGRLTALWQEIKNSRVSYYFMAPYLVLFFIFTVIPVITAIYLSFTYLNMLEPPKWIGWSNYRLLFLEDDVFLIALKNTLIFAVISGPLGYIASFMLAWLINQLRFRAAYTLAFYVPSITSGIAMAVVWMYFFSNDRLGLINNFLINLGIINEPVLWLSDKDTILPVIIIVSLWMSMGAGFLAFVAGLKNVPEELYEAGRVDGICSKLQEVWLITIPLMKPQLLFGAVMAVVGSFQVFAVAMQLAGFPSPLYAGHTIVTHLHDYAFIRYEMGYAAAISVVLFGMTFGLSRVFMKIFATHGDY
ncbi:MAG: sugar ABC transporter permease [Bacillota bacterium]